MSIVAEGGGGEFQRQQKPVVFTYSCSPQFIKRDEETVMVLKYQEEESNVDVVRRSVKGGGGSWEWDWAQSRQSAKLFLQSSELGLLQPLSHRRTWPSPPPGFEGRGTLADERGVGRVPIPTRGHTLVLFRCSYFVRLGIIIPPVSSSNFNDDIIVVLLFTIPSW